MNMIGWVENDGDWAETCSKWQILFNPLSHQVSNEVVRSTFGAR